MRYHQTANDHIWMATVLIHSTRCCAFAEPAVGPSSLEISGEQHQVYCISLYKHSAAQQAYMPHWIQCHSPCQSCYASMHTEWNAAETHGYCCYIAEAHYHSCLTDHLMLVLICGYLFYCSLIPCHSLTCQSGISTVVSCDAVPVVILLQA